MPVALAEFLRSSSEPLRYAALCGGLILFGLLERAVHSTPIMLVVVIPPLAIIVFVTWWDRICRTYRARPMEELATMRPGLEECQGARTTSLSWLLVLPFIPLAPLARASQGDMAVAASAEGAGAG